MRLPRALQTRLLVLVLGTSMLVWLAAAAVTWMDASHELDELLDGHLAQSAALLMVQARSGELDDDDIADAPSLHRYAPKAAFQVYVEGDLAVRSSNVGMQPMSPEAQGFSTVQDSQGRRWRVFASHSGSEEVAVYVGEEVASRQSILWAVMRSMFWPLALALPLLGALGWWSIRTGLAPLHALSQALRRRPPQATEPLTLEQMPPELVPLVEALNALLGRIGSMLASERRFTADAAHELRTPIAAIRAQAQVALGAGDNQPERQRALLATVAGCDRATRLVEQLLTLARLEAAPKGPQSALPQVDVRAVAVRVAGELAGAALARKQELSLEAPASAWVSADEVLLGVLVRNLLDNALRYSPEGAQVRMVVATDSRGVLLSVDDSGPGLSPEALARLGERFFRVLGSDQPGSGLGWSIVRRLVEVFGAQIDAAPSTQLGGLAVRVRWTTRAS
jgi:two-component system sensor histidine kinase QseC